jgi:hypothetical protein
MSGAGRGVSQPRRVRAYSTAVGAVPLARPAASDKKRFRVDIKMDHAEGGTPKMDAVP